MAKLTPIEALLALRDGIDRDGMHCDPVPVTSSWRYMIDVAIWPETVTPEQAAPEAAALLREIASLLGGWREAVVELEDFCREPVRLKNMVAAADQMDRIAGLIRGLADRVRRSRESGADKLTGG